MYTLPELSAKRINPGKMCFKPRLFFSIYYKTKDDAFKAASNTWKRDVGHSEAFIAGYDTFIETEITSESDFKRAWSEIYGLSVQQKLLVWCGHVLTHASKQTNHNDGLEMKSDVGNNGTLQQFEIGRLETLAWSPHSYLLLAGCNTGLSQDRGWTPANEFALTQKVLTLGQAGYAYFSSKWDSYSEKTSASTDVCLWAYRRGKNGAIGNGDRMPGIAFRY